MRLSAVKNLWRVCVLGLAAGHTAVACLQQSMNSDGLNYLTLGDAFWAGDWTSAVSGIWSPLYGVIAAGVLALFEPGIGRVFPTVQIVNFVIFTASLVCFERLWSELWLGVGDHEAVSAVGPGDVTDEAVARSCNVPAWLWWSVGYALFLWAGLNLVEIWSVTPDMLVAAIVYLASAQMVRIGAGRGTWRTHVALGATVGVGYLAKAPLFPLGLVALTLTALTYGTARGALRRIAPAALAFAVVAGPLFTVISLREGRPAFSQVGRFTYLKHVNRIPFPHWREGVVEGVGTPNRPPQSVYSSPDVFVYDGPVAGPYPPSLDPDYWTQGLIPRVDLFEQLNEIANALAFYFALFFRTLGPVVGVTTLVLLMGLASGVRPPIRGGAWYLSAWAVVCFAMYSLVFVTARYIGPFVVLFWAGLFSYFRAYDRRVPERLPMFAGLLVVAFTMVDVLALNVEGAAALMGLRSPVEVEARGQFAGFGGAVGSPPAIAAGLLELGLARGEDVAYVGYSYTAFWAYLVKARIVAEIWPEEATAFWDADSQVQEDVLTRFREAGASWVVAGSVPPGGPEAGGWSRVGGTGYWAKPLAEGAPTR